jgi:hypothetical protein
MDGLLTIITIGGCTDHNFVSLPRFLLGYVMNDVKSRPLSFSEGAAPIFCSIPPTPPGGWGRHYPKLIVALSRPVWEIKQRFFDKSDRVRAAQETAPY